jgi:hypothetical protein
MGVALGQPLVWLHFSPRGKMARCDGRKKARRGRAAYLTRGCNLTRVCSVDERHGQGGTGKYSFKPGSPGFVAASASIFVANDPVSLDYFEPALAAFFRE